VCRIIDDQTRRHDPIGGYVPNKMTLAAALELRGAILRNIKAFVQRWRSTFRNAQFAEPSAVTFDTK